MTREEYLQKQKERNTRRKEYLKEYRKKYYEKNKDKCKETYRSGHYKRKYKITIDEFEEKLEQQNGVCEICKKENINKDRLSVDHDHTTGKIRGLLCYKCNRALGYFNEDKELFLQAIKYLDKYK